MSEDDNDQQPDIARRDMDGNRPGDSLGKRILRGAQREARDSGFRLPGGGVGRDGLGARGDLERNWGPFSIRGGGIPQVGFGRGFRNNVREVTGYGVMADRLIGGLKNLFGGRGRDENYEDREPRGRRGRERDREEGVSSQRPDASQNPVVTPPHAAATQAPATTAERLATIDRAQADLNTGAYKDLTDSQYASQASANSGFKTGGLFAQTRAGANEYMNFKRELLENAGGEFDQTFKDHPDIRQVVVEQWRKEVGADSTSPNYRSGKPTILDKLGEMSRDSDRLDALRSSPNAHEFMQNVGGSYATGAATPQAGAAAPSRIVVMDPNDALEGATSAPPAKAQTMEERAAAFKVEGLENPEVATSVPAATASTKVEIKTGVQMNTAMLNRLSAEGILAQQTKIGQGADAPRLLVDREGKIHGGYTANDDGTTGKLVSRADLESRFSPQMLAGLEDTLKPKSGRDAGTQVAASNVPAPDAPKPTDLTLNTTQSPVQKLSPGIQSA